MPSFENLEDDISIYKLNITESLFNHFILLYGEILRNEKTNALKRMIFLYKYTIENKENKELTRFLIRF